jgi:hypothetical protein
MPLAEIKVLKNRYTPEIMDELFTTQIEEIDKKMDGLLLTRNLLTTLQETSRPALNVDEWAISIQSLPPEAIILGKPNDCS